MFCNLSKITLYSSYKQFSPFNGSIITNGIRSYTKTGFLKQIGSANTILDLKSVIQDPSEVSYKLPVHFQNKILKVIYKSLSKQARGSDSFVSTDTNPRDSKNEVEYLRRLLDNTLETSKAVNLTYLIKMVAKLIKLKNLKKIDEEIKSKADEILGKYLVEMDEDKLVKLFRILIKDPVMGSTLKNNFISRNTLVKLVDKFDEISEIRILCDLYWSLINVGCDFKDTKNILKRLVEGSEKMDIINNVKLLHSLYLYATDNGIIKGVQNNLILSNNENNQVDKDTVLNDLFNINGVIEYIKSALLNRIGEFDNIRSLCNFVFYVTSTINNFTLKNYKDIIKQLLKLLENNENVAFESFKIEGLLQLLWSFQKNNIYPQRLLKILSNKFDKFLDGDVKLSVGQLSLSLYALTYFNMLRGNSNINKMINFVYDEFKSGKRMSDENLLKIINIIWEIVLSHTGDLDAIDIDKIITILNMINWNKTVSILKFEDFYKISQIITILKISNHPTQLNIPDNVHTLIENTCKSINEYREYSVTQDKVRRTLEKHQIEFQNEYRLNNMMVDFFIKNPCSHGFDNLPHNKSNGLIIEIDGPFHYNILMDEHTGSDNHLEINTDYICENPNDHVIKFGILKLMLNGKTIYRNRILKLLGYDVVSIPWFIGYQTSFYEIIKNLLIKHKLIEN